jgi:hypothetical protein
MCALYEYVRGAMCFNRTPDDGVLRAIDTAL